MVEGFFQGASNMSDITSLKTGSMDYKDLLNPSYSEPRTIPTQSKRQNNNMNKIGLFFQSKYNKIWLILSLIIGVVIFIMNKKGKFARGSKIPLIALILFPVSLFLKKFIVKNPQ